MEVRLLYWEFHTFMLTKEIFHWSVSTIESSFDTDNVYAKIYIYYIVPSMALAEVLVVILFFFEIVRRVLDVRYLLCQLMHSRPVLISVPFYLRHRSTARANSTYKAEIFRELGNILLMYSSVYDF